MKSCVCRKEQGQFAIKQLPDKARNVYPNSGQMLGLL